MLELRKINRDSWISEFNEVMQDIYVSKKYNREKRLKDKIDYIQKYLPEIKNGGLVVDLGPGPGEFMEICREYGCETIGLDAPLGGSEMGDEYLKLSRLMVERQGLDVRYIGVENVIKNGGKFHFEDESVSVVNSQGAIEQIFKEHLEGIPCRFHKDCRLMAWDMSDDMFNALSCFFKEIKRILKVGGICLIYGNGAKNSEDYNETIQKIIGTIDGLSIELVENFRLHKIRKVK